MLFFDTSALGAAYLDRSGGGWIRALLFGGPDPAMVSELADVEFPSTLHRTRRNHLITEERVQALLDAYDVDTSSDGPIGVLRLSPATYAAARQIVLDEVIGTLDAMHLASAHLLQSRTDQPVTVVTLDRRQATAARRLGFTVLDGEQ